MANGTIAFDTLSTSGQISGTAKSVDTDYLAYGSAKVLELHDGGTTTIKSSLNVSSISDDATAIQTVTLANNMSTAFYFKAGSTGDNDTSVGQMGSTSYGGANTTSAYSYYIVNGGDGSAVERLNHQTIVHGDLA